MNADIKGALAQINTSYKAFEHNGHPMTKAQVKAVLKYGMQVGYKTTNELKDSEVDDIIDKVNKGRFTFSTTKNSSGIVVFFN